MQVPVCIDFVLGELSESAHSLEDWQRVLETALAVFNAADKVCI